MNKNIEINDNIRLFYDNLVTKYMKRYEIITKEQIQKILKYDSNLFTIKIVNNKLYFDKKSDMNLPWETRRESLKYLLLNLINKFNIPDSEFIIMYSADSINLSNKISEDLPLIVSTSCLENMNYILCPDFTFCFAPEYNYKNHQKMCEEVIASTDNQNYHNKTNKIVWRGSANNKYRSQFLRNDEIYDIKNILPYVEKLGQESNTFKINNSLTRLQKSHFKFQLHLNGHEGNNYDGAYSSAFKWGLMAKSLIFYCAPCKYKEFWMDNENFIENKHYIYCNNITQLDEKLKYYMNNQIEAEKIANNGFEFFKKYLLNFDNILYYMYKLINEYSKKMNYKPILIDNDILITNINYSEYLNS
jgi:hypothetical protein